MSRILRSVLYSAFDRYVGQVFFFATAAIMARLLTPAETGLFLIVNALVMLADNFRSFGVGIYIVQAPEIRRQTVQSAFTLTLALSLLMSAAIVACAGPVARFYDAPEIAPLLRLAAIGFIVVPFGSPITALLQREMAFHSLAVVNIAGAVAGAVATVAFGLAGFGAMSYVCGFLAQGLAVAAAAFAIRPEPWLFRPCFADLRRILSFGTITSAVTVTNMVCDMVPRLVFGKLLGMDAVALYGRAVNICQLPDRILVSALQPVVLPAMAARLRQEGEIKSVYLRGHAMMSALQWPGFLMIAMLADPIVLVLLGDQWGEVAPLLRIMAIANMALAPAFMTFPALVSMGRVRDTLTSSLISLPPSVALVVLASTVSLDMVAVSLLVTAPLQMGTALVFVKRAIGLSWPELVRASRDSLVVSLATAIVPAAVLIISPHGFALGWTETAVAVTGGFAGWLAACCLIRHPLSLVALSALSAIGGKAPLERARIALRGLPRHGV